MISFLGFTTLIIGLAVSIASGLAGDTSAIYGIFAMLLGAILCDA